MPLQISADRLSFDMQRDDVARIHQAMQGLGRDLLVSKRTTAFSGSGTAAVVKGLQGELASSVRDRMSR